MTTLCETRQQQRNDSRPTRQTRTLCPRADVYESEKSVIVMVDLPGVLETDVEVKIEADTLTLEGSGIITAPDDYKLALQELGPLHFRRVFTVSSDVEREAIAATLKNGVLTLTLPKTEPAQSRKIVVQG